MPTLPRPFGLWWSDWPQIPRARCARPSSWLWTRIDSPEVPIQVAALLDSDDAFLRNQALGLLQRKGAAAVPVLLARMRTMPTRMCGSSCSTRRRGSRRRPLSRSMRPRCRTRISTSDCRAGISGRTTQEPVQARRRGDFSEGNGTDVGLRRIRQLASDWRCRFVAMHPPALSHRRRRAELGVGLVDSRAGRFRPDGRD